MPLLKHAIKKMRQDIRKRKVNKNFSVELKSITKKASEDPSPEAVSKAYSTIDKAVKKNIIHKNTAARKKASLARKLALAKKPKNQSKKETKNK